MYANDYNKILGRMKTAVELARDLDNYERCRHALQHYERVEAWKILQSLIHEYFEQIEICGSLEGVRLYGNVQLAQVSDQELCAQLRYIGPRIPAYVLVRESQKELAKRICEWLDKRSNTYN